MRKHRKILNRALLCYVALLGMGTSVKAQKTIQLFDSDSVHVVPFELRAGNLRLRSDDQGRLTITRADYIRLAAGHCTLEFQEVLDNVLYRNRLYLRKGRNRRDFSLPFNQLNAQLLLSRRNNVFFLRQKEDAVDEEQ